MESKKSLDVHVQLGDIRSWLTVTLGLLNSLLFSGILFGWASLQAFLEDEGLYLDLCSDLSAILSCDQRKDRMLYLYSRGQMFSIFAYAFLSFLMDRTGPIFLSVVGGLLETLGLLLLAWADINSPEFGQMPFDIFDIAVVMTGVGASALMVHALTLAFLVPTSRFAMVMTLANCMVDGSAAMPALLYQLYRLGMSRQGIFTVYASLCFALNVAIIFSWIGPNMQKLRLKNEEESSQSSQSSQSSRQDETNQSAPRLHGLPLTEQCRSFEFAFAFVMFVTQGFSTTSYLGFNKNLLSYLGDDDNTFAQIFTALLPASLIFSPLFGMSLTKKGFAFTFGLLLFLGFTWSIVTLLPSLRLQLIAFLTFTNFRAMFYSAYFTFLAHTFGNRTFGSVNAMLATLVAFLAFMIGPCASFFQRHFGNLLGMSVLIITLMLPSSLMTFQLARHLSIYPSGDVRSQHQKHADQSQSGESRDICSEASA